MRHILYTAAVLAFGTATASSTWAQDFDSSYQQYPQVFAGERLTPAYVLPNGRIQRAANVYAVARVMLPESSLPPTRRFGDTAPSGTRYPTGSMQPHSRVVPSRLRALQAQQYHAVQRSSLQWSVGVNLGVVSFGLSGN